MVCLKTLQGHTDWVRSTIIQLKDGSILSGSDDSTLKIWDKNSGECISTLVGHEKDITCALQILDGRIVSGSSDFNLRIWDIKSRACLMTLQGHTNIMQCVLQLSDGRLVSGCNDETLKIWDVHSGRCMKTITGHTSIVQNVLQLDDEKIVSISGDMSLKIWKTKTIEQEKWDRRRELLLIAKRACDSTTSQNFSASIKNVLLTFDLLALVGTFL
jgi:WD40 repeat protein